MAEYRTIKRNGRKQVIRMDDSAPKPNLARSAPQEKWIQASDNPKHHGYVKEYIYQMYGEDAFTERGTIREEYLDRAIEHAKANHQITWEKRLVRARTLKNLHKGKGADPYGEPKAEAQAQAKELRAKGEKVRVEETSRKNDLYAPFVGDKGFSGTFKADSQGNVTSMTIRREKAKTLGKPVKVHIEAQGDPRKGHQVR